jgi:hypothetical protein
MEACEMELYHYMTKNLPLGHVFMYVVTSTLLEVNTCIFKYFIVEILCKRMSGEMNTSLGNGFTNWAITKYVFWVYVLEAYSIHEGDDGLIISRTRITVVMFTGLGLVIKIEEVEDICKASFCGQIFDPDDQINIVNPIDEVIEVGWLDKRYFGARRKLKIQLLRCKALSLAHQYPGCPVIQPLAQAILRVTKPIDMRKFLERRAIFSQYHREQLSSMEWQKDPSMPIPIRTRILMGSIWSYCRAPV